jgi:hypothetical protein
MQLITTLPGLNLARPNTVVVHAVQDDTLSRTFTAQLLAGDTPFTPPSNASAFISYRRADGVPGWYDTLTDGSEAVEIDGDTVTFTLCDHALETAGRGEISLILMAPGTEEAARLSSFKMVLDVEPTPYPASEIVTSEPYINVLSQQIAAVLEAAADLTGITVSATTGAAGSSATATVTGGSEGQPYHIAFKIPRGNTGATPNLTIGTVETVSSSSQAEATITGTTANPKLNLKLPRGVDGTGAVSSVMGVLPDNTTHDVPAAQLFNLIYPLGFIFHTTDGNFNPNTAFGGTWTRIKDTFLLAAGDTYAAASTGGAASQVVDYGKDGYALIGFPDADTTHISLTRRNTTAEQGTYTPTKFAAGNSAPATFVSASTEQADAIALGGSTTVNTLPPYLAVYVWQRTALAS